MVTVFHERGRIEGLREAIVRVLDARFGAVPGLIPQTLAQIWDVQVLDRLVQVAARADSLEEFTRSLPESPAEGRA